MKTFDSYLKNRLVENSIKFNGGFGRSGVIGVSQGICDGCHKNKMVLSGDSSEAVDYGDSAPLYKICKDCIDHLFGVNPTASPGVR